MPGLVTRSLLYADDTLIVESDATIAQEYMDAVRRLGAQYGLSLNESKLEVLAVSHDGRLLDGQGRPIKTKSSMVYLGGLLTANGRIGPELGRRIGAATQAFSELSRAWRHANLARSRKMKIYEACVVSR